MVQPLEKKIYQFLNKLNIPGQGGSVGWSILL